MTNVTRPLNQTSSSSADPEPLENLATQVAALFNDGHGPRHCDDGHGHRELWM